jgi:hypothetical protein
MSIALVVTAGFGNGTLSGTVKGVVLRGYDISAIIPSTIPVSPGVYVNGVFGVGVTASGAFGVGVTGSGSFGSGTTVKGNL